MPSLAYKQNSLVRDFETSNEEQSFREHTLHTESCWFFPCETLILCRESWQSLLRCSLITALRAPSATKSQFILVVCNSSFLKTHSTKIKKYIYLLSCFLQAFSHSRTILDIQGSKIFQACVEARVQWHALLNKA